MLSEEVKAKKRAPLLRAGVSVRSISSERPSCPILLCPEPGILRILASTFIPSFDILVSITHRLY